MGAEGQGEAGIRGGGRATRVCRERGEVVVTGRYKRKEVEGAVNGLLE